MNKVRVLVVDASVLVRRFLFETLNAERACEVVGTAPNGKIALAKLAQLAPDVVLLDAELPETESFETLSEMRRLHPRTPVIMVTSLAPREAEATLRALAIGAADYITKPDPSGVVSPADQLREQLLPRLRWLTGKGERRTSLPPAHSLPPGRSVPPMHSAPPAQSVPPVHSAPPTQSVPPVYSAPPAQSVPPIRSGPPAAPMRRASDLITAVRSVPPVSEAPRIEVAFSVRSLPPLPRIARIEVLAIGSSTGGPNALGAVLSRLAADFPVPVVITQHMPPMFTKLLAERLDLDAGLEVHEARGGEALEPGHIYLAPGDFHMVVRREGVDVRLRLHQEPPENSCRPAVDVMLRSVVETYRAGTLAVVLTGMGQDGLRGCEAVRRAGGQILVQDAPTSVVWGMPGAVAKAGLADAVLPIEEVAGEITRRVEAGVRVVSAPQPTSKPSG